MLITLVTSSSLTHLQVPQHPAAARVVEAAAATAALAAPLAAVPLAHAADGPSSPHGAASGSLPCASRRPAAEGGSRRPPRRYPTGEGPQWGRVGEIAQDEELQQGRGQGLHHRGGCLRPHGQGEHARGLRHATDYYFRFTAGNATSPVGRTRTTPAHPSDAPGVRFGAASCANWESRLLCRVPPSRYPRGPRRDPPSRRLHLRVRRRYPAEKDVCTEAAAVLTSFSAG